VEQRWKKTKTIKQGNLFSSLLYFSLNLLKVLKLKVKLAISLAVDNQPTIVYAKITTKASQPAINFLIDIQQIGLRDIGKFLLITQTKIRHS